MIGKPEWFTYRVFGWGIAPKTWQGWLYIAAAILITILIALSPIPAMMKLWMIGIYLAIIFIDVIHIMINLPKASDERENYHQLLIERNCSFAAIAVLLVAVVYQVWTSTGTILWRTGGIPSGVDVWLLIVLGAMILTKAVSSIYLRVRG
jgi:hypothetical protein